MKPDCVTCHGDDKHKPFGAEQLSKTCGICHTGDQVETFRNDLVAIKKHALSLSQTGHLIIEDAIGKGVLKKSKDGQIELNFALESVANQSVAQTIVERLRYYLLDLDVCLKNLVVGVAHSNPDYAHWYGNAPAKSDLIEIRDATHKLEQIKEIYAR
jgi:hypothetical protein